MSKEIEEIKKSISQRGKGDIFVGFEEILLSSLEKEEQAHVMSTYDNMMKIAELGIALEREKERADQAEYFRDGMQERVNELFIENERLKEDTAFYKKSLCEEMAHSQTAEKRVKELQISFGSSLAFERIRELEINLLKLVAAVKRYKVHSNDFKDDITFQKILEEVSSPLK